MVKQKKDTRVKEKKVETKEVKEWMTAGTYLKWSVVATVILCGVAGGCQYLNRKACLANDNIIEQSIEAVIEAQTGINIDLSPGD